MRHVAAAYTRKDGKVVDGRVSRQVTALRSGELVVTLAPEGIWLREPRRRVAYLMPYGVAFQQANEMYLRVEKKRKQAERKARRAVK